MGWDLLNIPEKGFSGHFNDGEIDIDRLHLHDKVPELGGYPLNGIFGPCACVGGMAVVGSLPSPSPWASFSAGAWELGGCFIRGTRRVPYRGIRGVHY